MSSMDDVLSVYNDDMKSFLLNVKSNNEYNEKKRLNKILSDYEEIKEDINSAERSRIEYSLGLFKELINLKYQNPPDISESFVYGSFGALFVAAGASLVYTGIIEADTCKIIAGLPFIGAGSALIMKRSAYAANHHKKVKGLIDNLEESLSLD